MSTKTQTTHAQAAKSIREELKKAFPKVKFSVRSRIYAGGNSVDVDYENGPTREDVEKIINKYQEGDFDGMTDCYNYSNTRKDIPQVRFVFARREVSEDIQQIVFRGLQTSHKHFDKVSSIDECSAELMSEWGVWTARNYVYRCLVKLDLTNGYILADMVNLKGGN